MARYRLRTWLRIHTPYVISDRIPKGARDCGAHEWYLAEGSTRHCYYCAAVDVELPVDPEDGLSAAAVSALHTFALAPDDHDERYDRLSVLVQWCEWAVDRNPETVEDLLAVRQPDGSVTLTRATRRSPAAEVVAEIDAGLQRALLETPHALVCVEEIVGELLGVHAHPEQLYGHLALVHGTLADASATHRERSSQHRLAHLGDGVFVGHRGVAPG